MPSSLRWRLAIWLVLGVALLWSAAAVVTVRNLRKEMGEVFDSSLQELAQRLLPLAVLDLADRDEDSPARQVASLPSDDMYFTYIVRNRAGRVLLRSQTSDESIFPPFSGVGFVNSPTHRIYFDSALQGALTIAVAEPLAHRNQVANEAFTGLAMPLGVLVPFSLLAVWVLVHMSMRPLQAFRAGIEKRGSGDLAPLPVYRLPSEIEPIAEAVNSLLERLRRTLEAERSFTANSAHELRTPVAAALAQTQRLISETSDPSTRERAGKVEDSLKRLARLSEKLMQLAKAEGGRLVSERATDVGPVLKMVVEEISTGHMAAGRIDLDLPDVPVLSHMDVDAFAILARNLIENALKHGRQDQPVTVSLSRDGAFRVVNSGPVVSQGSLSQLSRPFERGQTAADGIGLGLAIVQAIAAGSGGKLLLTSPVEGRDDGFEARFGVEISDS